METVDRQKMSTAELRRAADIAPNTMTRMKRDQEVTMQVLERICEVLQTDFGEIVKYLPEEIRQNSTIFRKNMDIYYMQSTRIR